jgi:hypothetical protein
MKKKVFVSLLLAFALAAVVMVVPAFAQGETPPPPNINDIFIIVASLVGFPACLAVGINVGKAWLNLPDGLAPKITLWATLAVFVGCGVALFTGHLEIVRAIDIQLGYVATFLLTFSAFVTELGLAKFWHFTLKGTPVIGKSFTLDKQKTLKTLK